VSRINDDTDSSAVSKSLVRLRDIRETDFRLWVFLLFYFLFRLWLYLIRGQRYPARHSHIIVGLHGLVKGYRAFAL